MTEFEIVSLYSNGFGFGVVAVLLILIYWKD